MSAVCTERALNRPYNWAAEGLIVRGEDDYLLIPELVGDSLSCCDGRCVRDVAMRTHYPFLRVTGAAPLHYVAARLILEMIKLGTGGLQQVPEKIRSYRRTSAEPACDAAGTRRRGCSCRIRAERAMLTRIAAGFSVDARAPRSILSA